MMNLKRLLQRLRNPLPLRLSKKAILFFVIVAILGFVDATYLTIEHYTSSVPPCAIGGCETVLTSKYSTVASVPVALLGSIYYLSILVLLKLYVDTRREKFIRFALVSTLIGVIASGYFLAIQAFVLTAYCLYCLGSVVTSTALFVAALVVLHRNAKVEERLEL